MSKPDKDGRKRKVRQQNGCVEETEGLARLTHGPELDLQITIKLPETEAPSMGLELGDFVANKGRDHKDQRSQVD